MDNDVLYAEAMLGEDAKEFLASEIGRYLLGRADQEIAEAMDKLKTVSSWRRKRIVELQNEIWRAESVKGWLIEMIKAGDSATHALEQQADE